MARLLVKILWVAVAMCGCRTILFCFHVDPPWLHPPLQKLPAMSAWLSRPRFKSTEPPHTGHMAWHKDTLGKQTVFGEEDNVDPDIQTISEMTSLLRDHGAYIHNCLEIRRCPPHGGRCIFSTCALEAGELLISIPDDLQLPGFSSFQDSPCPSLAQEMDKAQSFHITGDHVLLTLQLLEERTLGHASIYRHYIKMLPEEYPTTLWEEKEQSRCLAGSPEGLHVGRRMERDRALARIIRQCKRLRPTDDLVRWAMFAVTTRAFSGWLDAEPGKSSSERSEWSVLVPFADIANHANEPNSKWTRNLSTGVFSVEASKNLPGGSEVLISYGRKPNAKLLSRYGFVTTENPFDVATIHIEEESSSGPTAFITLSLGHLTDSKLLRTQTLEPLDKIRAKVQPGGEPRVVEVEKQTLLQLRTRCEKARNEWSSYGVGGKPSKEQRWMCDGYRDGLAKLASTCLVFADRALRELGYDVRGNATMPASATTHSTERLAQALFDLWQKEFHGKRGNASIAPISGGMSKDVEHRKNATTRNLTQKGAVKVPESKKSQPAQIQQ